MSSDGEQGDNGFTLDLNRPGDTLMDFARNLINVQGVVKINKDGSIAKGWGTRAVDEGVGEVSGRNAQRQALNAANDRLKLEEENASIRQANDRVQKQELDRAKSSTAAAATATARATANQTMGSTVSPMERDFLGL